MVDCAHPTTCGLKRLAHLAHLSALIVQFLVPPLRRSASGERDGRRLFQFLGPVGPLRLPSPPPSSTAQTAPARPRGRIQSITDIDELKDVDSHKISSGSQAPAWEFRSPKLRFASRARGKPSRLLMACLVEPNSFRSDCAHDQLVSFAQRSLANVAESTIRGSVRNAPRSERNEFRSTEERSTAAVL
jgi:hypothetical protein